MRKSAAGILPVITIDRSSDKPLYRQLYEGYRDAIVERRLSGGQRLPSTRGLAAELQISRIPVLGAFEQLRRGLLESRPERNLRGELAARRASGDHAPARSENPAAEAGPGPRTVARRPAEVFLNEEPGPWSAGLEAFQCCSPPVDRFPTRVWAALVARHSRKFNLSQIHYHRDPMGLPSLRETVAQYLRTSRAVRCDAGQIMVVSGSQQALDIASRVLLDDGSPVWIEEPGYWGARHALMMAGARLVAVPVDGRGSMSRPASPVAPGRGPSTSRRHISSLGVP
jgi:GntR family transcriptional regulator/MocR family aminotransferase